MEAEIDNKKKVKFSLLDALKHIRRSEVQLHPGDKFSKNLGATTKF